MPTETDRRVRGLLDGGDRAAAATLAIRELGPRALRYLRAILRQEDEAKDAFSQWAESVWRGLPGFRWESSLQTWILRLAYHAALAIQHEAWRRHGRRLETGEASRVAETVRTATAIRVERQRTVLRQLCERLTLDEQTLLDLRIDQGLSWVAIAEVLSSDGERLDPGTLAKRFERLKAHLAEMLKQEGNDAGGS
jgi:RNA polymerase sigma-70 factor, ECF subfamily